MPRIQGFHKGLRNPAHYITAITPTIHRFSEKAVQTVQSILKKCTDSEDDVRLALLDLRNTPRDAEIGSPMPRLMSRRAITLIPTSDNLRKPCVVKPGLVHTHLMEYRQKQKFYYEQHAKSRPPCEPGVSIRIQTPEGWKPAEYESSSEHPRSHIIKADSQRRTYRRNNCKLMKTRQDPHSIHMKREVYIPSNSTQMKQETVDPQIPKLSVMNKPSTDPSLVRETQSNSAELIDG